MGDQDQTLAKKVKKIVASPAAEHILTFIKAGVATAPFLGGIATLMTDYIPSAKQGRLEEFLKQFAADLTELKDRVDEKRFLTDEFAFVFEKSLRGVAENYQAEKIESFRGILINAALGADVSEEEQEYFLNLVNALSVLHIRILRFLADPPSYLEANHIPIERIQGGFSEMFPIAIPGINLEIIKMAFNDLYQYGLITTDKSIFGTMTSAQGLRLLGNRVSGLGKQFMNFCTKPAA